VSRSSSSRSNRHAGPQAVGEVLSRYLSRSGLAEKVEAASVVPDWDRLVGAQIASVTQPLRVSGDRLFVAVENSAWMMELNLMKADILRHLNAGKKRGRIEQIHFVMHGSDAPETAPSAPGRAATWVGRAGGSRS
jgi:predicted nucleic acid-binding Zn ribbon protein